MQLDVVQPTGRPWHPSLPNSFWGMNDKPITDNRKCKTPIVTFQIWNKMHIETKIDTFPNLRFNIHSNVIQLLSVRPLQ